MTMLFGDRVTSKHIYSIKVQSDFEDLCSFFCCWFEWHMHIHLVKFKRDLLMVTTNNGNENVFDSH